MKRALIALVITMLSILPAQAMTFNQFIESEPEGRLTNFFRCTWEQQTRLCVDFILDSEAFRAVLAPNEARTDAEIVTFLSQNTDKFPEGEVSLDYFTAPDHFLDNTDAAG